MPCICTDTCREWAIVTSSHGHSAFSEQEHSPTGHAQGAGHLTWCSTQAQSFQQGFGSSCSTPRPAHVRWSSSELHASTHPPSLLLCAVGMPVQTGEHSPRGHQLTGLIPAMGMAEAGGVALALSVQDHIQPADTESITHAAISSTLKPVVLYSEMLSRGKKIPYEFQRLEHHCLNSRTPVAPVRINSLILQKGL